MRTRLLLAALSALLLGASFPPIGLTPLAWFSLVPLFCSLAAPARIDQAGGSGARLYARLKAPLLIGFVFGFIFFLSTVYWVVYSMYIYGGVPFILSLFFMVLLVIVLALYPALFAALWVLTSRRGVLYRLFLIPSAWVALEYLRSVLFTGFPWALIGYTQAREVHVIQVADIFGVWGISFLVIMVNFAIYACFFIKVEAGSKGFFGNSKQARWGVAVVTLALLTSTLAYGFIKIRAIDERLLDSDTLRVGVAQGNIDQSVKWEPELRLKTIEIYTKLSLEAAKLGAKLIIWPESAVPFYLDYDKVDGPLVREVAKVTGAYLLTGSPHYEDNEPGSLEWESYYNSVFLLDPGGDSIGRYDKVKLVPFGEYVPLKRALFFIKKLTEGYADFSPGPGYIPIEMEGERLGVLICFESIFPDISSTLIDNGASLLIVLTNDGWFGKTSAAYQHFDMAILRAVENRVFLLRAANRGISGVIDPAGRVVKETSLLTRELFTADVKMRAPGEPKTFFTRYGRYFPILLILFFLLSLFKFTDRR